MNLGKSYQAPSSLGVRQRAGRHQNNLQVHAAKKDSSPWSSGGPKRSNNGGKSGGSGGSTGGSGSNGKHDAKGTGSNAGSAGNKAKDPSFSPAPGSGKPKDSPWGDFPERRGLPARPSKPAGKLPNGALNGAAKGFGAAASGLSSRLAASRFKPETTITDPVNITLLDELSPSETVAEPKWGTFCSHLSGEWVGQYAAYTPWDGKPEPAWLDERGKYIQVVYTRALECRHQYDFVPAMPGTDDVHSSTAAAEDYGGVGENVAPADVLLRKIGRCTSLTALSTLRLKPPSQSQIELPRGSGDGEGAASTSTGRVQMSLPPRGSRPEEGVGAGAGGGDGEENQEEEEDVDLEALAFNTDGIIVFDGGYYSAGPEYIGQQAVKLVNDDVIRGDSASEAEEDEEGNVDPGQEQGEDGQLGGGEGRAARASSGGEASSRHADGGGRGGAGGTRGAASALSTASSGASSRAGEGGVAAGRVGVSGQGGTSSRAGGERSAEEEEEAGEGEDEEGSTLLPTTTSVFEQCLVDWGTRSRMRLKVTLRMGQMENGEVDVEVLRILLFKEQWLGPATTPGEVLSEPPASIPSLSVPCTQLPRPTPAQLQGSWNVFTVGANGVDEVEPFTGQERTVWVYGSTEEQQLWDTTTSPPSGDDGGSYWLPGGVVLSLRMLDNYVPAEEEEAEGSTRGVGAGEQPRTYPRGLCISMAWLWREGSLSVIEREYDGYGYLREVRLAQGVKGGWSGGRM